MAQNNIFDPAKPVQTRDGRKARIICTNRIAEKGEHQIVALITNATKSKITCAEFCRTYYLNGCIVDRSGQYLSELDLINIPETRNIYVNVYEKSSLCFDTENESRLAHKYTEHLGKLKYNIKIEINSNGIVQTSRVRTS